MNLSTWKTVTRAHSKESKFLRSHFSVSDPALPSFSFWQNLQPNKFIPSILQEGQIGHYYQIKFYKNI